MPRKRRSKQFYCVYILYGLATDTLYVGFTRNLSRRLRQHHAGTSALTTNMRPLKLVACEYFLAKTDALRREAYLKTPGGERSLRFLVAESLQILGAERGLSLIHI